MNIIECSQNWHLPNHIFLEKRINLVDECLIPKGLYEPGLLEWPSWIWTASFDHNFFFDFLKLFVGMRLAISFIRVQSS
jgi:hypothetical protein